MISSLSFETDTVTLSGYTMVAFDVASRSSGCILGSPLSVSVVFLYALFVSDFSTDNLRQTLTNLYSPWHLGRVCWSN